MIGANTAIPKGEVPGRVLPDADVKIHDALAPNENFGRQGFFTYLSQDGIRLIEGLQHVSLQVLHAKDVPKAVSA
jgi:hypothetical protein